MIQDRLKYIIENQGFKSNAAFSKKIGISSAGLGKIINGERKPSYETIQLIAKSFPEYSSDWLLTGKEPIKKLDGNYNLQVIDATVRAGEASFGSLPDYLDKEYYRVPFLPMNKKHVGFKIEGESMAPRFNAGDIAIIDTEHEVTEISYDTLYLIFMQDNSRMIKVLRPLGEDFEFISINKLYPPFTRNRSEVVRIYKVVEVWKQERV